MVHFVIPTKVTNTHFVESPLEGQPGLCWHWRKRNV